MPEAIGTKAVIVVTVTPCGSDRTTMFGRLLAGHHDDAIAIIRGRHLDERHSMAQRRFQFGTRELLRLTFLIALMIGCIRFSMTALDNYHWLFRLSVFAAAIVTAFAAAGALRQRAAFGAFVGLLVICVIGLIAAIEVLAAMLEHHWQHL